MSQDRHPDAGGDEIPTPATHSCRRRQPARSLLGRATMLRIALTGLVATWLLSLMRLARRPVAVSTAPVASRRRAA